MLKYPDGIDFTIGRSRYDDHDLQGPEGTAKIHVKINPGSAGVMLAELDTGAAWSILDADVAEALDLLDGEGIETELKNANGDVIVRGRLERIPLVVIADENQGRSLTLDGVLFLVSPEWRRQTFLGYTGLLQNIRFAVDPHGNWFYFGP
jgi:hypothetical protein